MKEVYLLIETWLILFVIIYIRNKIVEDLQKNNIYIYQKYCIKNLYNHWSIFPPTIMLFLYIIFEIMIFNGYRDMLEYGTIYKQLTLLSYFGLVCHYELYDSMYEKYKNKSILSFITSPFMLAIVCLCVGYLLNYIAIQANGGHMPVYCDLSFWSGYTNINEFTDDSFYILGNHDSKMIIFCDIFDTFYSTMSLGDLLVRMYVFIIIFFSIKNLNKNIKY